jgi:glyoxylase-like metal-dependent hydrolase (beta-lactamase superfamily II)
VKPISFIRILPILGVLLLPLATPPATVEAQSGTVYSVWLIESSRFVGVPFGAFAPDRTYVPGSTNPMNNINTVDLPVNVGIIKGGNDLVVYDTGWKQQDYLKMTGSQNWAPIREQMAVIGLKPEDVTKVVIGHGHWDHAGQVSEFPNAILYVQKAELDGIEWALNYPNPKISAVNTSPGGCMRTPACGYPPDTVDEIYGKVLRGQARILHEPDVTIAPGLRIFAAHRGHTAGSQLLWVNSARGPLMFGSDTYSSWEAIRDWYPANIQQTDTVQQFLAYEKCYIYTGGFEGCVAAHEPLSYTDQYPITANAWVGPNGSRGAEVALAPGEASRRPR